MTDTQPMQADGGGETADAPDGVENAPAKRAGGGESSGGAYPNPQTGKKPENDGFMGHGGQTEIDYSGSDGGKENAATQGE